MRRLLNYLTKGRPVRRIYDNDGDLYLERYYLLGRQPGDWVDPAYVRLGWLPSVWLHRFIRPDMDRELHNHPWRWALSFILRGSYDEERMTKRGVVMRRTRLINLITRDTLHRIATLHGDVWTMFIIGPKVGSWGFLRDGEVVPWRDFLRERGAA